MNEHSKERQLIHLNDSFHFQCGPGASCFTQCCRDVTIFLTPYDVIRMKNRLGISSGEFLEQYATTLKITDKPLPLVVLKMGEDRDKLCPFVTPEGCRIYTDRPWPCRMYPLDQSGPVTFRVIGDPSSCKGLKASSPIQVSDYLVDQGVLIYREMETLFEEITGHSGMRNIQATHEQVEQMLFMALYDLDAFRSFVFQSRFLGTYQVDVHIMENIRRSDVELMKFAFQWVRHGLFGDPFYPLQSSEAPPCS